MDAAQLRTMISLSKGGPECLIGVTYGEGGRTVFTESNPFKESMIQDEFLVIPETDLMGYPVQTFKCIESIIAVTFCENPEDRRKIDRYYLRN